MNCVRAWTASCAGLSSKFESASHSPSCTILAFRRGRFVVFVFMVSPYVVTVQIVVQNEAARAFRDREDCTIVPSGTL